jgi:hypothetical protein
MSEPPVRLVLESTTFSRTQLRALEGQRIRHQGHHEPVLTVLSYDESAPALRVRDEEGTGLEVGVSLDGWCGEETRWTLGPPMTQLPAR